MSKILVAVICTDFKSYSLNECIKRIKQAGFNEILLNYEGIAPDNEATHVQEWMVDGSGFSKSRQFDQDQEYRLSRICVARNMCLDFAQQGGYDWILFVDSDVMIPDNTMDLFEPNGIMNIRSGIVPGRGIHSHATYVFGNIGTYYDKWISADYFTCGFMAIHESIYSRLRFRWGRPIDHNTICSEDPLFGSDARIIFNAKWYGNTSVRAEHFGDLKDGETSQF